MNASKIVAWLVLAAVLAGCSRPKRPLTVGAKDSTEQAVLAEIVAQHLEKKLQVKVQRQIGMGSTLMAHQALISGEVDVYPEYTGDALAMVLKLSQITDPDIAQERVRREYSAMQLVWMPPLGFDRRFVMVTRSGDAGAATLSDAAQYKPGWTIGVGHEFLERPGGYSMLMRTYNLPVNGAPKILQSRGIYGALADKQVSLVAGNATDGMLGSGGFRTLDDDRQAFPPDHAALVARAAALQRHPGMQEALEQLSGRFPAETMRKLNYDIDGLQRPVAEVAREFLSQAGL